VEGVGNEANIQSQHVNDDNNQITAKIICLIQNNSLISTCAIDGKQLFSFAVSINHGEFRYFDLRTGRIKSINENMFGDY
jgi:hypothetical protein